MPELVSGPYNTDDESRDACPTCGARVDTKATYDADGSDYRLECRSCSWTVPLERPPTATRDDAQVLTDGGTTSQSTQGTARDRLAALSSEAARNVRAAIDGTDADLRGADLRAVLEQLDGQIAYVVQHKCGVEYIYLGAESIHARTRRGRDAAVLPPTTLETDAALARRTRKRFDVIAYENLPAWVLGGAE
ncbi:hypothetical protein [Halopiger xanaduensis]|uniref:Uncharacterized protein n=1 Tax=Halopiger xanaduensis (strain DSM 18323 / JCM 14033 / SH-6) TaxID=797210 RepID=F8DEM5_HALXS|nr:hypothetical protein [Halopiger xanaduensis]AEH39462.1 hypothetical protein Halxa_0222 [Halopiger xanaduensis SH-6]